MRHQDDLVGRAAGYGHDLVDERFFPVSGEVGAEAVGFDLEPVRCELLAHEGCGARRTGGSRHAVRIEAGELVRKLERAEPVERRRQRELRRGQRLGFVHAEGGR